ncbi:MAG: DUF1990 family protein [Acidimicrobiales bacterium]
MADATRASPTCHELGATAGEAPPGYHVVSKTVDLGDEGLFDRARLALIGWQAHLGAGVGVR